MPSLYKKPCATSCVLYFVISFFSLRFCTNTYLYMTGTRDGNFYSTCGYSARPDFNGPSLPDLWNSRVEFQSIYINLISYPSSLHHCCRLYLHSFPHRWPYPSSPHSSPLTALLPPPCVSTSFSNFFFFLGSFRLNHVSLCLCLCLLFWKEKS